MCVKSTACAVVYKLVAAFGSPTQCRRQGTYTRRAQGSMAPGRAQPAWCDQHIMMPQGWCGRVLEGQTSQHTPARACTGHRSCRCHSQLGWHVCAQARGGQLQVGKIGFACGCISDNVYCFLLYEIRGKPRISYCAMKLCGFTCFSNSAFNLYGKALQCCIRIVASLSVPTS